MSENRGISIDLVKGTFSDYIIKDKNNIFIGRFTIVELDKDNKKCTVKLKFYKENKYDLLKETVQSILRAIFKDTNIYKANVLVDENIAYKVFLDLGFTLEGIFTENLFSNGVFLDELSFGINRNEYNNTQRSFLINLVGENVTVKNLTPDCAEDLLDYNIRNKDHLSNFEPSRDNNFYTYEAQRDILLESYKHLMSGTGVDFGIYKDEKLIGKIKISNIVYGVFKNGIVGYSMDKDFQGRGYMKEALRLVIDYARDELELHRLEASVLTDNEKSKSVLNGCGFEEIGLNEKYLFINGSWKDHITFFKILEK
ncbi:MULTISPECIES: GNAT family protein [unclassified Clostridium]|uniref:GNAT family N-acetyltransferase n=2 Tax=Bacillota TaxID=1239 RepID=UPI0018986AF1|nr:MULTISPECIES: GNAT family protein [unclassified Clostridium]MCR1951975.1 GNAT family N-acetyltransferase [Clostridium sp. DSM 100503]